MSGFLRLYVYWDEVAGAQRSQESYILERSHPAKRNVAQPLGNRLAVHPEQQFLDGGSLALGNGHRIGRDQGVAGTPALVFLLHADRVGESAVAVGQL